MMLSGMLYYFTPFHFTDGKTPDKNKYLLTLGIIEQPDSHPPLVVVASLPSSQDHNPRDVTIVHGCNDFPDRMVNCYHFDQDVAVTENGFAFPRKTYIYGEWITDFPDTVFTEDYNIELGDYEIVGRLTKKEFDAIIACLLVSCNTKRKYKKILQKISY